MLEKYHADIGIHVHVHVHVKFQQIEKECQVYMWMSGNIFVLLFVWIYISFNELLGNCVIHIVCHEVQYFKVFSMIYKEHIELYVNYFSTCIRLQCEKK
jgi:hypothetical protein